jgi:phenylpropionate dioxygenase-like ring-hydroxylating dioxygenase large terminal subunit
MARASRTGRRRQKTAHRALIIPSPLFSMSPDSSTTPLPRNCTYTEADWRALSCYWHPVAFSKDVHGTKPRAVTLLDVELVLYRAGGTVVAARDLCLHRGVPLSLGWIEGEEIVCAYHGFRYGPRGECTTVPAQPKAAIPKKLCLTNYPVSERHGLVWVCLSGEPRLPIPEWPQLTDSALRTLEVDCGIWKCSAARHTENFNDLAHLSWIHAGTFGNRDKPEVPLYEVERTPDGLRFQADYDRYSLAVEQAGRVTEHIRYAYDHTLPFYTRLSIHFPDGSLTVLYDLPSPVSSRVTKVFFLASRNRDLDGPDEPHVESLLRVLEEDKGVVEAQRPEELPLNLSEEFHIRADRFSTIYRQLLKEAGLGKTFTS